MKMKWIVSLIALGAFVCSESAALITTDFEGINTAGNFSDWDAGGVSATGTTNTWQLGTSSLSGATKANVLNPGDGNAWLNPVPAEIGSFGVLQPGCWRWLNTGIVALENTQYEFSVTQFRRDDVAGGKLELRFNTADLAGGDAVSSGVFDVVITTNTFVERSVVLDTAVNTEFVGETLRILVFNNGGAGGSQTAIDNISVSVLSAEPGNPSLIIGTSGSDVLIGATDMNRLATYTLQGIESLRLNKWADLGSSTTGVESVEWTVPATNNAQFFRLFGE